MAALLLSGCSLLQGAQAFPGSTSGRSAGDLFVYGQVTRDGAPVEGAEVSLLLEDIGAEGEAAYDVSPVTTGPEGGYAFDIDPDELPAQYLVDEDYVNFDLSVDDGSDRSAWSTSVWLVDDTGWRGPGGTIGDAVPAVSFDLGHGTVEVTDSTGASATYGE